LKRKRTDAKEKADNSAEVENERLTKQTQKEEKEKLQKVVFFKDGSKAKMVKVTTGIADDTNVEIKSGVQPGDEVISGSYSAISRKLKNGAKLTMEKADKK
jgi:HlyD family secretion protein